MLQTCIFRILSVLSTGFERVTFDLTAAAECINFIETANFKNI
jgi:hypothetical protein